MAKVRNKSGVDRDGQFPSTGAPFAVKADGVLTVPDGDLDAFVCQEDIWERASETKTEKRTEGKA